MEYDRQTGKLFISPAVIIALLVLLEHLLMR